MHGINNLSVYLEYGEAITYEMFGKGKENIFHSAQTV